MEADFCFKHGDGHTYFHHFERETTLILQLTWEDYQDYQDYLSESTN